MVYHFRSEEWNKGALYTSAAVAGAVAAVMGTPFFLGTVGYTAAGITKASLAAKMMSVAALANGGGVASGTAVAVLQSVGAAGLGTAGTLAVGAAGAAGGVAATAAGVAVTTGGSKLTGGGDSPVIFRSSL